MMNLWTKPAEAGTNRVCEDGGVEECPPTLPSGDSERGRPPRVIDRTASRPTPEGPIVFVRARVLKPASSPTPDIGRRDARASPTSSFFHGDSGGWWGTARGSDSL